MSRRADRAASPSTPRPASHEKTIGARRRAATTRDARPAKNFFNARGVHGEVRTVPARALHHAAAIDARGDELDRILFDRRHQDEHVAHERRRHLPRLQIRRTDLNVHGRLQLLNQDRLAKQRFDFRAHQAPLRVQPRAPVPAWWRATAAPQNARADAAAG